MFFNNEFQIKRQKTKLRKFIEGSLFQNFILGTIILNSILLGVMTYPSIMQATGNLLHNVCFACVGIFVVEILLKFYVYGKKFFKSGWNNFDLLIVLISLVPTAGAFSSLRVFRVLRALRALRLISKLERLRIIVQAIIDSIPNVGWASVLLFVVFYIFSVMGTTLFAAEFPDWFGTIGKSMYTLFQVMTLESWSMGIARPVIAVHPFAWMYFIFFILVSSFIVMNVIVGVVVNAISEISTDVKKEKEAKKLISDEKNLTIELVKLKRQIELVENLLEIDKKSKNG